MADEDTATQAADLCVQSLQHEFVADHPGALVTDASGRYADIVFFADEAALVEAMAAEQASEVCHEFMSLWDGEEPTVYRVLPTHG